MRTFIAAIILILAGFVLITFSGGGSSFIGFILIGPFPLILSGGEPHWIPVVLIAVILLVFLLTLVIRR
jgi:uncharacterized membrane protein